MKRLILFLCVAAASLHAHAQQINCSYGVNEAARGEILIVLARLRRLIGSLGCCPMTQCEVIPR